MTNDTSRVCTLLDVFGTFCIYTVFGTYCSCYINYHVKPQGETRHPICGDAKSFQVPCSGCDFPDSSLQPSCQLRGCLGEAMNATEDGLFAIEYTHDDQNLRHLFNDSFPDGAFVIGQEVKASCPTGYRVPTTDVCTKEKSETLSGVMPEETSTVVNCEETTGPTKPVLGVPAFTKDNREITRTVKTTERSGPTQASDNRYAMSMCGHESCSMTPVTCRRLACGNFSIPANSTGSFKGAIALTEPQYLMFNDSLTVTCADNYILDNSDLEQCAYEFTITCTDEGVFESNEHPNPQHAKCLPASKRLVFCDT